MHQGDRKEKRCLSSLPCLERKKLPCLIWSIMLGFCDMLEKNKSLPSLGHCTLYTVFRSLVLAILCNFYWKKQNNSLHWSWIGQAQRILQVAFLRSVLLLSDAKICIMNSLIIDK